MTDLNKFHLQLVKFLYIKFDFDRGRDSEVFFVN